MSERDELRDLLLGVALQESEGALTAYGAQCVADAVLAEIEREHVIVPRGEWEECACCECEDCYPELTQAAGKPLPEGVTSVSWGWGELPGSG